MAADSDLAACLLANTSHGQLKVDANGRVNTLKTSDTTKDGATSEA